MGKIIRTHMGCLSALAIALSVALASADSTTVAAKPAKTPGQGRPARTLVGLESVPAKDRAAIEQYLKDSKSAREAREKKDRAELGASLNREEARRQELDKKRAKNSLAPVRAKPAEKEGKAKKNETAGEGNSK